MSAEQEQSVGATPTEQEQSVGATPTEQDQSVGATPTEQDQSVGATPTEQEQSVGATPTEQEQSVGATPTEQEQSVGATPAESEDERKAVFTHAAPHFSADIATWGDDISPEKSGELFKEVLREGVGEDTPLKGDKVYVHYEGRLMDQKQFDSSKGAEVPFEVNIGLGQVIKGWDIGIVTMKKGEICLLTCLPKMAYGGEEFQDSIPPNATIQFEIELISWHGMYCTKDPGGPEVNVLKSFIKEGDKSGSKVKDSADVTVHITGKFQDQVFFKKENFTFSVDEYSSYDLPHGIEHGIKKMKKGEVAKIYLPPCYGFGTTGNEEFGIPPSANLVYEINLLDFTNLKEYWEYDTIEERQDAAAKFKLRGTALLQTDQIQLALKTYEKGYDIVKSENLEEEERAPTKDVRLALKLNISLCQLKLRAFASQYNSCTEILQEDPNNLKALFRRGMAAIEINEFEKAISDFDRVLQIEPDNKGALKLKEQAKAFQKEQNMKEKRLYTNVFKKMFAKTEPDIPKDTDAKKEGGAESEPCNEAIADPSDKATADPSTGATADTSTGATADTSTGATADPSDKATADPSTGATADTSTGATADTSTGATADTSTGATADPSDKATADPSTGATADPSTGATADTSTGATADPSDKATADPSTGATADPSNGATADP